MAIDDMILHYDFSEGSGDTVYDRSTSGSTNDGTVSGPSWVSGENWMSFLNENDNVRFPDLSLFSHTQDFTISMQIRPEDFYWDYKILTTGAENHVELNYYQDSQPVLRDPALLYGPYTFAETWHHLVAKYNANNGWSFWVDGEEASSDSDTTNFGTSSIDDFNDIGDNSSKNNMTMSDFRVYDRTLSDNEIVDLYNALPDLWGGDGSTLRYEFTSQSGDTVIDQSDNSNDGTITGATWDSPDRLYFDSADDYVTYPNLGIFDASSSFAFSAYIYPEAHGYIIQTEGEKQIILKIDSSTGDLQFEIWTDGTTYITTSSITTDQWHHILARYDKAGIMDLSINDTQVDSDSEGSGNIDNSSDNNAIGISGGLTYFEYMGYMSDIRIYDRDITDGERELLYNQMPIYPIRVSDSATGSSLGHPILSAEPDSASGDDTVDLVKIIKSEFDSASGSMSFSQKMSILDSATGSSTSDYSNMKYGFDSASGSMDKTISYDLKVTNVSSSSNEGLFHADIILEGRTKSEAEQRIYETIPVSVVSVAGSMSAAQNTYENVNVVPRNVAQSTLGVDAVEDIERQATSQIVGTFMKGEIYIWTQFEVIEKEDNTTII